MKFVEMPKELQTKSIETLSLNYGMPEQIIEKDWWVSAVMRALFALPYANQMSFKGGTSLSKCWGLIDRFSEDIDIAVAREFPGYGGELSRTQISDKLRRASCYFVREKLQFDIRDMMIEQGIPSDKFSVEVNITSATTPPGNSEVQRPQLPHRSQVNIIYIVLTRSGQDVGGGLLSPED